MQMTAYNAFGRIPLPLAAAGGRRVSDLASAQHANRDTAFHALALSEALNAIADKAMPRNSANASSLTCLARCRWAAIYAARFLPSLAPNAPSTPSVGRAAASSA